MRFCLFVMFRHGGDPSEPPAQCALPMVREAIKDVPRLARALVHTPAQASDPFLGEIATPLLVLQLYFAELADLEVATRTKPLQTFAADPRQIGLAGALVAQQTMLVRGFDVPEPAASLPPRLNWCSYLVAYEGAAADMTAWLAHYLERHTTMMARMPGIRELEVYTRIDAVSRLPVANEACMQRNRVMFDSPEALTAALNSPIRAEMRADFQAFPAFTGGNVHYPMTTWPVRPPPIEPKVKGR